MADAPRARRLAVRIREIVASTLEMQVKDPRLRPFVKHQGPHTAATVDALLAAARDADAEVRRARAGASYAGDPDPYRAEAAGEGPADPTGDRAGAGAAPPRPCGGG